MKNKNKEKILKILAIGFTWGFLLGVIEYEIITSFEKLLELIMAIGFIAFCVWLGIKTYKLFEDNYEK